MAFIATPLLCPFILTLDIFTLKKDIAKTHSNNVGLNILHNAPLAVYQVALAGHWLVMGFKTDSSPVDARLSKMEAIVSLAAVGNLVVDQLMEHEVPTVAFLEEPKWTMVMDKNVRQVVSRAMEILANMPKQK
jgi:hypothetical protein